jgi:hypothetical protein
MTSLEATKVFLPLSKGKERETPKGRRNKTIRKKFLVFIFIPPFLFCNYTSTKKSGKSLK